MPRNTAKDDPAYLLMRGLVEGGSQSIENMEADGQRELVKEGGTRLPTELGYGTTVVHLLELGFILGTPVEGDPLFRDGALPDGWRITPTEHTMHSNILDDTGRTRGSIFYKAAHYDRHAILSLIVRYTLRREYPEKYTGEEPVKSGAWDAETETFVFLSAEHAPGGTHPEEERARLWLAGNYPDNQNPCNYWGA